LKKTIFEAKPHTVIFFEILFLENAPGIIFVNQFSSELLPYTLVFASPDQIKKNGIPTDKGYQLVFKNSD